MIVIPVTGSNFPWWSSHQKGEPMTSIGSDPPQVFEAFSGEDVRYEVQVPAQRKTVRGAQLRHRQGEVGWGMALGFVT